MAGITSLSFRILWLEPIRAPSLQVFPIVNTLVTPQVNKGPFFSAFKCDTKECLCMSTLVCGRLVSLSHYSFWQNGSILYPGKVELAERTISNLKNRQSVTLWKKIKQWTPRVALQFCFLSLSIYGYVFISVCAIWKIPYLVLPCVCLLIRPRLVEACGGFVGTVNDLKTELN